MPSRSPVAVGQAAVTYRGQDGVTALVLLMRATSGNITVRGSGANAFVTAITGQVADESKKQYWALYVDGRLANLGAGSLVTRNGQVVTWKLETY